MTTTIIEPDEAAFALPPIVSAEGFSAWTKGQVPATDARVLPLLKGASAGIRRWCGWHVAPVLEETLSGDGPGSSHIVLPTGRLLDVLTASNAGDPVDVAGLDWSRHGIVERRELCWSARLGSVEIRVRHGYDLAEVPDVAQIVKQVTANALASPMGATREQAGTVSISWATTAPGVSGGLSLLQRDLETLAPFRI